MPQLVLFKRRWRIASDTVPILALFLAIVHLAIIIPIIAVAVMTEGGTYTCNHKGLVQSALFGPMVMYLLAAVNELITFSIGLNGGPLEERKRRAIRPLLYIEIILWVLVVGWTIASTYVAYDPAVNVDCWSNNPCDTIRDVIPSSCTPDGQGEVVLTPSCQYVLKNGKQYSEECLPDWLSYASTWAINNYNHSRLPPYNPPSDVEPYTCNKSITFNSPAENQWLEEHGFNTSQNILKGIEDSDRASAYLEQKILSRLGIPVNSNSPSASAPWFSCFSERCQSVFLAGDNCTDWKVLLSVPDAYNRKKAFIIMVYSSWAIIAITLLVVYFAFNAFPEYNKTESWEHTVQSMSRFFCCQRVLENASTSTGETASKEIGRLLHILFGGIDLDPTDQFLGIYLVAERQRWRRQRHVLKKLKEAGIYRLPPNLNFYQKFIKFTSKLITVRVMKKIIKKTETLTRGIVSRRREEEEVEVLSNTLDSDEKSGSVARDDSKNAPTLQSISEGDESSGDTTTLANGAHSIQTTASGNGEIHRQYSSGELLPSPVEGVDGVKDDSLAGGEEQSKKGALHQKEELPDPAFSKRRVRWSHASNMNESSDRVDNVYKPPSIAHSFVRLVSMKNMDVSEDDDAAGKKGDKKIRRDDSLKVSRSPMSVNTLGKKLVMDDKPRPLLTPLMMKKWKFDPPTSSYEAAEVYCGRAAIPVEKKELMDVLEMSKLARAAYGLQSIRWNGATATTGCGRTVDSVLSCCSPIQSAFGLQDHFKARNFQAILNITGAAVDDLLYVSYSSAAFGALPYMVLLHRPSRSVVMSIRGTVGYEDLITDLLSNPVDATDALPQWVVNEANADHTARHSPGSPQLFAHAGILSSTTAVLKDLREQGLLSAMTRAYCPGNCDDPCESKVDKALRLTKNHTTRVIQQLETLSSENEVELDLGRAHEIINAAIAGSGWKFVVVGHSLGAAVACMVSFHLRQDFPTLKCFALCPPGGLLSDPLSRVSQQFCTSIICGNDPIPRLGLPTTQRIVDEMVLALARCKRPKLAILFDIVTGQRNDPETAPPTFCAFDKIGMDGRMALQNYVANSRLHSAGLDTRELYPPGRIIHLRPFTCPTTQKNTFKDAWDAVWVSAKDVIDEGMLLSLSMTTHHKLSVLEVALNSAIADEAVNSLERKKKTAGDEAV